MNRLRKSAFFTGFTFLRTVFLPLCLCVLLFALNANMNANAASAKTSPPSESIYKRVDAQGRVTYSNAPIQGGAKVELEPITLIPPTPSGVLVDPRAPRPAVVAMPSVAAATPASPVSPTASVAAATPDIVAPEPAPAVAPIAAALAPTVIPTVSRVAASPTPTPTAQPIALAIVTPMPQIKRLPLPANLQTAAPAVAVVAAVAKVPPVTTPVQPPRDDTKLRNLRSSLDTEQRLLAEAKTQLIEENGASEGVRAIKASFNNKKSGQLATVSAAERAIVERHFERVRDLQDQVAMHEKNIATLRANVKAEAGNVAQPLAFNKDIAKPISTSLASH